MEQTMIVTTSELSSMTAMMPPAMFSTPALWATAVWGTKPALDHNTPLQLPSRWDSSTLNAATAAFLREAVKTARYSDN
jgi:hypothetical protein